MLTLLLLPADAGVNLKRKSTVRKRNIIPSPAGMDLVFAHADRPVWQSPQDAQQREDGGKALSVHVRLLYETGARTQPVDLGIDAGSRAIGIFACAGKKELYAAEVELRPDVTEKLSMRREMRRGRRYHKTRYRSSRFNNRVRSRHKGWLAPIVEVKIASHLKAVGDVMRILPISHITVETASFDIQKVKTLEEGKPLPEDMDYQHGDQLGFWNVQEYVLFRDGHACRCCGGRSKDRILNVHHIES